MESFTFSSPLPLEKRLSLLLDRMLCKSQILNLMAKRKVVAGKLTPVVRQVCMYMYCACRKKLTFSSLFKEMNVL